MEAFVARQPIFDKKLSIYGYELLFRKGLENHFPDMDEDRASSQLLSNSFLSIGIDRLVAKKRAFINFPRALLLKKVPTMFPSDKLSVEVLETVRPDEEIVKVCRQLAIKGYELVLDDFSVNQRGLIKLVELASMVKIDVLQYSQEALARLCEKLKRHSVKLVAEKVEDVEMFQTVKSLGFDYYQGYFFCKPEIVKSKDISPNQLSLLNIITILNKKPIDTNQLVEQVAGDVSFSYKLLRYINSAYYRRSQEITSIRHAIVYLGLNEFRGFILLVAATELAHGKPVELLRSSMIRAKLCESLAAQNGMADDSAELFMLGLFSLMDAVLDKCMAQLVKELPFSKKVASALTGLPSAFSPILEAVKVYMKGDWGQYTEVTESSSISLDGIADYYVDAVEWVDSLLT